jgi:hypothetical protein
MNPSDTNDSANWATAVRSTDRLLGRQGFRQLSDPRLDVQTTVRNVFLSDGPTEVFSQAMPAFTPESPGDDELKPIDILYGRYLPSSRRVEIFVKRIEQDAPILNCDPSDLLTIVRTHEYVHAVCHLGVPLQDIQPCLSISAGSTETDWATFGAARDRCFANLDTKSHELIAQAITWCCLYKCGSAAGSQRLMDAFSALEARQAPEYQLTQSLKSAAPRTNWRLVLDAARGVVHSFRGTGFEMREGLASLIETTAEQAAGADR